MHLTLLRLKLLPFLTCDVFHTRLSIYLVLPNLRKIRPEELTSLYFFYGQAFPFFLKPFYSVVPWFGARAAYHGWGQLGKPINAEFSGFSFIVRFVCMLVNMRNYSDYS